MDANIAKRGINSPFDTLIQGASMQYAIPVAMVKAVISRESAWDPNAVNPSDPSYGLMQLNAHYWGTPQELLDPATNIQKGTAILSDQFERLGALDLAVAAYNAGTYRSAQDLQDRINNNTLGVGAYVQDVLAYARWFAANDPLLAGTVAPDGGSVPLPSLGPPVQITDADIKMIAGIAVGLLLLWALLKR